MKFRIVFWDVLPCKIIVDRRFRGTCCLHHQSDDLMIAHMMEAARTSETSVDNYFTWQYIPEDNSELKTILLRPVSFMSILMLSSNLRLGANHRMESNLIYRRNSLSAGPEVADTANTDTWHLTRSSKSSTLLYCIGNVRCGSSD
jgi:hypothetical protein